MGTDVARLVVVVEADTTKAEQGIRSLHQSVSGLGSLFGVGAAAGAGFGVALAGVHAAAGLLSAGFQGLVGGGIALNTSMENVSAQLVAMTKDGGQAAKILADIRKEADQTPFAFEEMARATASLLPAAKQSGTALMDLVKQAEVLAATHPEQGLEGAAFALREALSGDFTSVVERFDLPRQRLMELKNQGVPAIKAIQTAMREMGLDESLVANLAQTMTGRWSTFQDTLAGVRGRLTSGLFDGLKQGLMTVQGILDRNADAINAFASGIGSSIGAFVSDAIPKLLAFAQQAIPVVTGAVEKLRTVLDGLANGGVAFHNMLETAFGARASNAIVATLDGVRGAIGNLGDLFSGKIGLGDLAGNLLGGIRTTLRSIDVGGLAQDLVGRIGAGLGDVVASLGFPEFGAAVQRFFQSLPVAGAVESFRDAVANVAGALGDLVRTHDLGLFADDVREAFGVDLTPAIEAYRRVRDAAADAAGGVAAALPAIADGLAKIVAAAQTGGAQGALDAIVERLRALGATETGGALAHLGDQVGQAFATIARAASDLMTGLGNIARLFGESGAAGVDWGKALDAGFANAVRLITAPITAFNLLVEASRDMAKAQQEVSQAIIGAWQATVQGVEAALQGMGGALADWAANAQRTIEGWVSTTQTAIGGWRDAAVAAFEAMRQGAADKLADAANAVGTFVSDVIGVLRGLVGGAGAEASKVGAAIVDGLQSAIEGGIQAIADAAARLVTGAINAAKRAAGISSPSRVFVDIGEDIVEGFRLGIVNSLDSLPSAFQRMTHLFRDAAQSLKGPIDDLIGRFYQGVTSMGKDVATGYFAGFLRSNNIETARRLADALRGYLDEYLDKLGTLADDAVPAVKRVQEDLANGLADAVASATKSAADAVDQAAAQIQDAISSLAESRDLRGRRATFAGGQSAAAQARRQAREDTEAQYQLQQDLAKASSDAERQQILARFKDAEAERQHRRQLEAEDRAFAAQQAAEAQAFEDQLADEALAKQLARIGQERDARLKAVQDELAAREAGLVATARTALTRIVQDLNDQLNKSLGAFFDNLPAEMAKRGGPTDPGFLGAVRNDVAGLLVPIVGMIQSLFANLVGIGNDYGPGVPLPALPPGGAFTLPALPSATPAPRPAPPVVINVAGSVWSLSELASAIRPELQRVVTT